ncbi:MAG TPA: alkaline phosphatase family protein [Pseudomonadota bacterium]|nr:alkaline phosphatase family protein [Pseudomonadota bacterium]
MRYDDVLESMNMPMCKGLSFRTWIFASVLALFWSPSIGLNTSQTASAAPPARPGAAAPLVRPGVAPKPGIKPAAAAPSPKLVVLLVADQFRADNLIRWGHLLSEGGLKRLMREGARATGRYGQQNTYTGPGHALIATGSYGYMNGITQNKFWNRQAGRAESMLYDGNVKILGEKDLSLEDDSSPRNLVGSTLFDELRFANKDSKVVSVSLKARGAILLGGHTGHAYWFSDQTGEMTTSTFYMQELPEWAKRWNSGRLADKLFGKVWDRLLPESAYTNIDASPHEADLKGLGRVFPHPTNAKQQTPNSSYYESINYTPTGLEVQIDFARAAIEGEQLGQRGVLDALAVSISGTDLAGHLFGPYSHEYQDMVLRLDRAVEKLLTDLEKKFKPGELVIAFTADHGAAPIPEEAMQKNLLAGRVRKGIVKDTVQKALSQFYSIQGEWVAALEDPSVYISPKMIAQAKADPAQVEEVAGRAVLQIPGVIGYYTRTQLMRGWIPPTDISSAVLRSYFPSRGGEIVLVMAPFYFWGKYGEKEQGTSHGSFYRYDTEVPMVFWGQPYNPGEYGVIDQIDFAATLSHSLKINPPAGCAGRPFMPMLKPRTP